MLLPEDLSRIALAHSTPILMEHRVRKSECWMNGSIGNVFIPKITKRKLRDLFLLNSNVGALCFLMENMYISTFRLHGCWIKFLSPILLNSLGDFLTHFCPTYYVVFLTKCLYSWSYVNSYMKIHEATNSIREANSCKGHPVTDNQPTVFL